MEFIPLYAPAQGGAGEAMMKQFKIVLSHILDTAVHKPKFVELLTYVGSAVRIVNERPLVLLTDDPRDFTAYRCDGYAIVFTSNLNSFHLHVLTYIVLPSSPFFVHCCQIYFYVC